MSDVVQLKPAPTLTPEEIAENEAMAAAARGMGIIGPVTHVGVQDYEEAAAADLILAQFEKATGKREIPKPCGYFLALKIFVRPEELSWVKGPDGAPRAIIAPDTYRIEDKYRSVTALVVAKGPNAYKDKDRFPDGPWCRIGDWVIVPRNQGLFFHFNDVAMLMVPDEKILAVVNDPASVTWGTNDKLMN